MDARTGCQSLGSSDGDLKKWQDVYVTHISDYNDYPSVQLKGTLFLTEHATRCLIQWIPDPDQDEHLPPSLQPGYKIDVNELHHLKCVRLPGARNRALYFVLQSNASYGPFEFRMSGATEFMRTLTSFVCLTNSELDKTVYEVRPHRRPQTQSLYQLPSGSTTAGQRLLAGAGILGESTLVKAGASLRRHVTGPLNNFIEMILTEPNIGVHLDETGSDTAGYNNPYYDYAHPNASRERLRTTEDNGFAVIEKCAVPPSLPIPTVRRGEPLTMDQWKRHLDPYGRVTCVEKLRQTIFEGGIHPTLRPIVWRYLLNYYIWNHTAEENEKRRSEKHREYHMLKRFWKEMSHDRLVRFGLFRDRKSYIDKDVPRTDRKTSFYRDDSAGNLTRLYDILITYSIYNMDFGYFQGMNDLLALILYVIHEEEDSFWCFAGLMERLEANFDNNLNAVREQFFQLFELIDFLDPQFSEYLEDKGAKDMPFCFRWLLIQFKREFTYKDVMVLWEAIWSEHLTKNFHIFFAAAVLITQRQIIMERNYDANSILKHINDLSYHIPLEQALNIATGFIKQLDPLVNTVPPAIRKLIEGPSLSTSIHVISPEAGLADGSGDISPQLDYIMGSLNDDIEDLRFTESPTDATAGMMIPVAHLPKESGGFHH